MAATSHWNAAADFPVTGSFRDKLGAAVKIATRASAAQPLPAWQLQLSDQFVELSAGLPSITHDLAPDEREAMIHCGAALQHLKLALKRHHCFGRIELFPDLDHPMLAARIYPGSCGLRDTQEEQLSAVLENHANLSRPATPATAAALELLGQTAPGERGWLELARSDSSRQKLQELLRSTNRVRLSEIRVRNKTLVRSPDGHWKPAGFTGTTLQERIARWRQPTLAVQRQTAPDQPSPLELGDSKDFSATFAVLKTKTDDKHGWLAAGRMLARLLLHARVLGVTCTPFLDALQPPELRTELRTAIGHKGFTQVILKFDGPQLNQPPLQAAIRSTTATGNSP